MDARARRVLLSAPVPRVLVVYVLARLPAASVWLSVVLDVSAASGSYARAGAAVGAYGAGVALLAPAVGRLADRLGARTVLLACAALQLPALVALAATADGSRALLLAAAFAAGAVQPPLVPCMRAAWAVVVPEERDRELCFSFDTVLGEVVDLAAPVLAVVLHVTAVGGRSLEVVGAAVLVTTAAYALVVPPAPAAAVVRRPRLPDLRPVLPVLLVVLLLTAALGAVEVAAVALADDTGRRAAAGLLLGAFTLGSVVGGVLHASRRPAGTPARRLLVLLVPLGGGLLAAALLPLTPWLPLTAWLLAPLLAVAGLSVAPLVTVLLGCLSDAAPEGALTETFTYATTANFVGVGLGSAVAGAGGESVGRLLGTGTGTAVLLVAVALVALTALGVGALARAGTRRPLRLAAGVEPLGDHGGPDPLGPGASGPHSLGPDGRGEQHPREAARLAGPPAAPARIP